MSLRNSRLAALTRIRELRATPALSRAMPIDPWRLVSRRFSLESPAEAETLFAIANGYMGIRGAHDEGHPSNDPGFFLNGFHETWPIPYGEAAFGFATTGQTIVSAPDGSVMRLYVDEEPLVLTESALLQYERLLDMRSGLVERTARFRTARGAIVQLRSQRLASLHWRHLAAISYEVTLISGHGGARDRLRARDAPADAEGRRRPARRRADGRVRARARQPVLRRHARPARAAHALERDRAGVRHGAQHRDRAEPQHRVQRAGGRGARRLLPRRRAGRAGADHEAARLSPRRPGAARRPRAAREPHARPRRRRRLRAHRRGSARAPRRLLGALRHRDRRSARHPAGRPLQPLPDPPGVGPRRGPRDRRQGPDRPRLRGPVLLGHGDLRAARADVHAAARRAPAAALPLRDARGRTPPGAPARPPRRAVSVAHDLRRGGVGVLRGRHRAVPHQRGDLLRRTPVRRASPPTRSSSRARASRSSSRPRACGPTSASSPPAATGSSASRASPARTSTPPSSTTTPTRT